MIRSALQVLFLISTPTLTSVVPEDPYKCFEHDNPPVDTSATFHKYDCKDNHGNIYKPTKPEDPAQLKSCCECLEYRCAYLDKTKMLHWKTSVSDQCCLACTNTTYKADTVIETIELNDDCKSIETQVCRKLPGLEKAKIESEFNYQACCNDNTGLQVLGTEVYQPSTCSQRTCLYNKYSPFSLWISKQVLPGCNCCLRSAPRTGREYLVADGTTWVEPLDRSVFECCRGKIVMRPETSTPGSTTHITTPVTGNAVLITGGLYPDDHKDRNATLHSAEIFLPNTPSKPCILHDLPAPYYGHTQHGGMLCGGCSAGNKNYCRQWNSTEGKFLEKPVHEFEPGRCLHLSWTPIYEKETFLIGGLYSGPQESRNTSTIVTKGQFNVTKGFDLAHIAYFLGPCSIPDPETDTFIITGGNCHEHKRDCYLSAVYNENGFVEHFGNLTYPRRFHGCTSYVSDCKTRIFMVTGGDLTETTEIFQDRKWKVLPNGNLPIQMWGFRLITIHNEVFSLGGRDGFSDSSKGTTLSSILKFNMEKGSWHNQSYQMTRPRVVFGISVVDFKDYSNACQE